LPTHSDTDLALELAGFCAAHGVWCIADGETLIPILAFQRGHSEQRELTRVEADRLEDGVAKGKQWVTDNPEDVIEARGVAFIDSTHVRYGWDWDFRRATYSTPKTARTTPVAIVRVSAKNLLTLPGTRGSDTSSVLESDVVFAVAHSSPQPAHRQY
jgi:hypothetical protein